MTDSDSLPALIQAIAEADSAPKVVEAVEKLAQARQIAAIPNLITILGYNNPGAAVAAVAGLIDLGKPAVEPLLELLDGYNYGARAWGLRALAGIGDPRALNLLLDAAENDFALSVRRAATRGLGTIRWEELPGEEIAPAQSKVNEVLAQVALDNEWVVRYAAITGLQELAIASIVRNPDVTRQILERFDRLVEGENNLAVIARIWLAQKEIQTAITEILTQLPTHEPQISNGLPSVLSRFLPEVPSGARAAATAIDWQATLEKLYTRKRQEQPTPEGDPRKFRAAAAAIIKGEQS